MKTIVDFACLFVVAGIMLFLASWLHRGTDAIVQDVLYRRVADERLLDGLRLKDRDAIEVALADGASPEAAEPFCRHTAIMIAASSGDLCSLRELLARGASVDSRDLSGMTALSHAAHGGGTVETASELIQAGAEIDVRDHSGLTPLALAALHGREPMIRLLVEHGADVNLADEDGCTPLMLASGCSNSTPGLIRMMLLEADADPTREDLAGRTAVDYALATGNDEIAELLRKF